MNRLCITLIGGVILFRMFALAQRSYNEVTQEHARAVFCKGDIKYNYKWGVR